MKKCILLGIDAPLSPATRQAIRTIKGFVAPMMPHLRIVLLHVITLPSIASSTLGVYTGQFQHNSMTAEQRYEAEALLSRVRAAIQESMLDSPSVEICIRVGSPVEEIVRMARETHSDLVIIGSRGNAAMERVRRFFMGSKSRRVLQCLNCPVMVVTASPVRPPDDLVVWYEGEITRYLRENPGGFTVFNCMEVARMFAPGGGKKEISRKERTAAARALEILAGDGVLCCHEVAGELRYVND